MENSSRRSFVLSATALLLSAQAVQAQERKRTKKEEAPKAGAGGGDLALPMVDPNTEPMAKSVNFVKKHSDVTKADLKMEKQGVAFEKQNCKNCMLYTAVGKKDGAEVGKCTLFSGKLVGEANWCTSWAKKA